MDFVAGAATHPAAYHHGKALSSTFLGDGPGHTTGCPGDMRVHPATQTHGKAFSCNSFGDGPGSLRMQGPHPSAQHLGVEYACSEAASLIALGYRVPVTLSLSLTVKAGRLYIPPVTITGECVTDRAARWLSSSARFILAVHFGSDFTANTRGDTACAATAQQQILAGGLPCSA